MRLCFRQRLIRSGSRALQLFEAIDDQLFDFLHFAADIFGELQEADIADERLDRFSVGIEGFGTFFMQLVGVFLGAAPTTDAFVVLILEAAQLNFIEEEPLIGLHRVAT